MGSCCLKNPFFSVVSAVSIKSSFSFWLRIWNMRLLVELQVVKVVIKSTYIITQKIFHPITYRLYRWVGEQASKQAYSFCFWKASTYLSNNQFKLHLPEMREKNKLLKLISSCKWYIVFNKHVANLIEWLSVYVWVGGRCFQ